MLNNRRLRIGVISSSDSQVWRPEQICFDHEGIYYGPLMRGLQCASSRHDVELVYAQADGPDYLTTFNRLEVDALLLIAVKMGYIGYLQELADNNISYVAIALSGAVDGKSDLPTVDASNHEGGRLAARHLIDLGHKRLGCINIAGDLVNHSDRMQGFLHEAEVQGVPVDFDCILTYPEYRWAIFDELIGEWIDRLTLFEKMPTAIFACDYLMTVSAFYQLQARHLSIPSAVSLIGFDDPARAAEFDPPLTTVKQPVDSFADCAIERIVQALRAPGGTAEIKGSVVLPTELMDRRSTTVPSALKGEGCVRKIHLYSFIIKLL